jgi:alpha-glucosidase
MIKKVEGISYGFKIAFIIMLAHVVFTLDTHAQSLFVPNSIIAGRHRLHTKDRYASLELTSRKRELCDSSLYYSTDSNLKFYSTDSSDHFISVKIAADKEEHFFGLGEQFSRFDMKGSKPYILTQEGGIGRGDKGVSAFTKLFGVVGDEYSSYAPINFFLTNKGRAFIVEGGTFVKYDFTGASSFGIESWGDQLLVKQFRADNPKALITQATSVMGRMPLLPDWAYGTWLGLQGGSAKVDRIIEQAEKADAKVTAVWIQDWVGRRKTRFGSQLWWTWQADTLAYPEFKQYCAALNKRNIKVLGYINSFLANEGELCQEARAKNYLVKNKKGQDYEIKTAGFPAYLVDLTNPHAFEWLKSVIRHNLIDQGLSGWMADYAEWLPADAVLYNGMKALDYHNQYAVDWARLNREAIQEAGREGDFVFFTRSGALGSAKYSTLFWAGDQMVSWGEHDGFPSAVCAVITSGLSGLTLNHSDIGGYTTLDNAFIKVKRDDELLKRWIEFAAFTPVYRTHEGLIPESNRQVYSDDSIMQFFCRFGKMHWALKDYFKALNQESAATGIPMVRALLLEYPTDTATYSVKDEFLLGQDLLIAPVIEKGALSRRVYFPAGEWENVWTHQVVKGGAYETINAALGYPPVYVRVGGIWSERLRDIFNTFSSPR